MESRPREVQIYVESSGAVPFDDWLATLKDSKARAAVDVRMARLRIGLLGEVAPVGEGVLELKIDVGPGYRIYCVDDSKSVLLLCAGSKKTQRSDIARAKRFWKAYRHEEAGNA